MPTSTDFTNSSALLLIVYVIIIVVTRHLITYVCMRVCMCTREIAFSFFMLNKNANVSKDVRRTLLVMYR